MADAPEIKVKLTAEDTGVSAAIKELGNQLKTLKTTQDSTAKSAIGLSQAFQGIALGAIAYKIADFGKSVFDAGTQIARASQITGASVQTLGVFHKAAGDLGISTEVVDKSFVRLSRSILAFQQGNPQVVQAFKQLGISQKDFAGLNTDQKIKLVTDRLGGMAAGTNKAALAQQLLGRGGAEALPVLQDLAGSGFAAVEAEARKMGLLFDGETAGSILQMQKSLEDLKDEAQGAATQFEVGLIPSITNVATAITKAINGSGGASGFKELGEDVGGIFQRVTYGLVTTGQKIAEVITEMEITWQYAMDHLKDSSIVAFDAMTGNVVGMVKKLQEMKESSAGRDLAAQLAGVQQWFKDANAKSDMDIFGPGANVPPVKPPNGNAGGGGTLGPQDAAAKAQLALLRTHLEDERALWKAHADARAEDDKQSYEAGLISLKEYFDRRRADVAAQAAEERSVLVRERNAVQAAANEAGKQAKVAGTPQEADRLNAEKIANLRTVDDLNMKIAKAAIDAGAKTSALDAEEFKKKEENQKKLLTFQEQILEAEGKTYDAAVLKIRQEGKEMADELRKSGGNPADATALMNQKLAAAAFEQQQKTEGYALQENSDKRAAIDDQVKTGQLFQVQGEEQIKQVEQERLAILEKIAKQLHARAETSGADTDKAAAAAGDAAVAHQKVNLDSTGQDIAKLKGTLQGSLTSGFSNFFQGMMQGTQSVGQAFKGLAASVIGSLASMMAQMLAQMIMMLMLKSLMGGFAGGGSVGAPAAGHAEGGLIRGPGGPKSDSIPARVSPGEYIVKADAVSAFGVANLEAINRGLKIPSLERLALPKFAEGGLVGNGGGAGGDSNINLGIGLDEGLILKHLSSKAAGRIVLQHLVNNPKAAGKALSRSD